MPSPEPDLNILSAQVLDLSQAMRMAAQAGDWTALGRCQQAREALMPVVFGDTGDHRPAAWLADPERVALARTLLELDRETVALSTRQSQSLQASMSGLQQGAKGQRAYQAINDL